MAETNPETSPEMSLEMSLEAFLAAPRQAIKPFAPASMMYAAAGTRRSAALAGLTGGGDAYARWNYTQMLRTCDLIFQHGVRHIFTILAAPGQFAEVGPYRRRLTDWIHWAFTSAEARAEAACYPWKLRLWTDGAVPELLALQQATVAESAGAENMLWCLAISNTDALWQQMLTAAVDQRATTRAAAAAAYYGQELPPVTLYLAFGKPVIAPDLLPPLLMDKVQCYWTQQPGYRLSEEDLRRVLYDYAFVRRTWQADKSTRGESALAQRAAWERGPILGLGRRLGPFWYPQDFVMPGEPAAGEEGRDE